MRCLGLSTLIFSNIHRLGSFLGGQNLEFQYYYFFFGGGGGGGVGDNFCRLLITFENNLDPDQVQHFAGPDVDPSWPKTLILKNNSADNKKACKISQNAKS